MYADLDLDSPSHDNDHIHRQHPTTEYARVQPAQKPALKPKPKLKPKPDQPRLKPVPTQRTSIQPQNFASGNQGSRVNFV